MGLRMILMQGKRTLSQGVISRSFFSDFHGQGLQSTLATLASLQAILEDKDLGSSVRDSGSGNDYSRR